MRKVLFLATVFAFVGFSNAQQKMDEKSLQTSEVRNNFDVWSAELGLSEAQITQIKSINEKADKESVAIRNTGTAKDFKDIADRKEKAVHAILTAEQKVKIKEIESKRNQIKLNNSKK